ncbi:ADP-ribose pyrophosphatase YjhB, NUDIX family [Aeromonas sp. RU39B]|jgi:8-oxo-dGTP pyrophosphatase MutT (NUDIX family)|uniref:NUDIX hydrolase n=1 Tax=Aeromonas sp. RU39B TaxID=1907416 RepID=UPI000953DB1C|nr:NUDIX domain-containing protein [Aeromonas sp. RU39B]SIR42067.1 ADP-ribose pyrophosphatase YjhB, NUDIX family [Aeromonas sp. RU39B]
MPLLLQEAWNVIDKLAWICIKEGRLLCVRSHGKTLFYLPGGKRETGESDEQALLREIDEELSVQLVQQSIRSLGRFVAPADGKVGVEVMLSCYQADYQGSLQCAAEIAELDWLDCSDLARCSEGTRRVLLALQERGALA